MQVLQIIDALQDRVDRLAEAVEGQTEAEAPAIAEVA
jgi:hypothetical protein